MSQRFLGRSDGRLSVALRAIHKLEALGINEPEDIARLVSLYRDRVARVRRRACRRAEAGDAKDRRLAHAQWAVRWMMALGFNETEIGGLVGVSHSTIAHLLDPREPRSVSRATARRLVAAVRTVGLERLDTLLPRLAITVLDTCNDKGRVVDGATRSAIADGARQQIRNALLLASSPTPVVSGIHAFLAQIGEPAQWMYLFAAPFHGPDTAQARIEHLRRLEHEADHLVERFRDARRRLEKQSPPATLPSDGRIA